MSETLPIDAILPQVTAALRKAGRLVLQAPPGAGKTTRVPLAILEGALTEGRIVMLEPRRLAARAAAERMAQTLGEEVGRTVGYRIRGQSKTGKSTRIEVITEGILTRMLQDRPDLPGVGCVIFDEFHERSLNADLGLALCLEVAEALRDDLLLVAMSATLDAEPVAALMDAPILTSQGRSFPVSTHWLDRPLAKRQRLEDAVADLTLEALHREDGSALVFLPGEGEIRRTQARLKGHLPSDVSLHPLFGAMDFKDQRAAIAPATTGRKVVLATSIAETSLTIEGIRIVIDAGRARRSEFDPSSGMARLVTTRVSRAEAIQRAGRAGRVAPGACYKLWTKGEDGALPAFAPAEIEVGDLTGLALEIALWGGQPEAMRFLSPPHAGRMGDAQAVLQMLGALDAKGRITDHGRRLAALPLHPRLAHMVALGGSSAPLLAALLAERDILRGASCDLTLRVAAARDPSGFERTEGLLLHRPTLARVREDARRLQRAAPGEGPDRIGILTALAYPDRVGLRRPGDAPRFVLSGGKGALLPEGDPLAAARLIVATDLDGDPREARIRQAVALSMQDLRDTFADQIAWHDVCVWSRRENRVEARQQERFGALILEDRLWREAPPEDIAKAMLEGIRHLGLASSAAARRLMVRAALMRAADPDFPDLSEPHLMDTLEGWLQPHLTGIKTAGDWKSFDILPALQACLGWDNIQKLDRAAPAHFVTPLGRKVPIDYADQQPRISVRLQEMFGVTQHPKVAGRPVQVTLLSPAQRPVQVTEDLPQFWASSYADVRKDMRGRYPKHPWPEDPTAADPTLRAKPRK
ncbi:ATP-dependent helicase HrpB [Roseobacter weihaiensis]|uniref:ATP-dependent helicase HrpB n=1 Tax=Roseobacter weihaiensis TaxID=2763262 RepID=UPI001D0B93B0|nr:ATP-dependent helicase HrpB [Roseobacter sp. H9]